MDRQVMIGSGHSPAPSKSASRPIRYRKVQGTERVMAQLNQFAPPANQADLTGNDQTNFAHQWSGNVNRWTETAILGNPWGTLFDQNRNFYYNPLTTDVAHMPISKPIAWTAFPNRILLLLPNAT